jgi:DNA-binding NtrC family response regulator
MKIRVLLVDDEKDFVESLSQRLELRQFEVKTALNGDEAIGLVKAEEFDVIILDVQMPGKDGVTTLKEIKQLNALAHVIMLTGHATVETAIAGMKIGAYDFLIKPTDTEDLVNKINAASHLKQEHEERIRQAEIKNILKKRGW